MSNDFFSTSKVLEDMRENLPMLSGADLDDLKDAIMDELKARERKQVIELKEKAIQALRDFFNAGGSILFELNATNDAHIKGVYYNEYLNGVYFF